jgi:C-terminal processing protease CtpA/Prc
MSLVVQSPGGQPRELAITSKIVMGRRMLKEEDYVDFIQEREAEIEAHLRRHRYFEGLGDVFIWKMPQFDLSDLQVDEIMGKVAKRKSLILDLRGNGGGYEKTLQRMIGNVFDRDIKIGDIKRRKEEKPLMAKSRGEKAYKGEIIVLVDSESGSAAEIFARVIQIEKRGTVLGDRTSGAVMRSRYYPLEHGTDRILLFGLSITDADVVMTDGKSLEHEGVVPDQKLLLSGMALSTSQDPVLSIAAAKAGLKLDPMKAGALFPFEWGP